MSAESAAKEAPPSPTIRLVASLFVFVHLFFVLVAMSGNLAPRSDLHRRLLTRFAFYTRLLNLDLDFTPYHLTHASEQDVDHRIEILPAGGEATDQTSWIVLPDAGSRASERYKRYQRLGRVMAMLVEDDSAISWIASGVATHFLNMRDIRPRQLRSRRHMLQGWEAITAGTPTDRDPNSDGYFRQDYLADCIVVGEEVRVNKLDEAGEIAQPGSETGDGR